MVETLFDEVEQITSRFVCLATEANRYDFSVHYSQFFFGKSMVTCLQSSRMVLMSAEDVSDDHGWATALQIAPEDVEPLKSFFQSVLSPLDVHNEY